MFQHSSISLCVTTVTANVALFVFIFSIENYGAHAEQASRLGGRIRGRHGGNIIGKKRTPTTAGSDTDPLLCKITMLDTMFESRENKEQEEILACIPIVDGEEHDDLFPINLPQDIKDALSFDGYVSITEFTFDNGDLIIPDTASFEIISDPRNDNKRRKMTDKGEEQSLVCKLTIIDTMHEAKDHQGDGVKYEKEKISCIPIMDGEEYDDLFPIEIPQEIIDAHGSGIDLVNLIVSIAGATLVDDELIIPDGAVFTVVSNPIDRLRRHLEESRKYRTGKWTIAIVRISTIDSMPTTSKQSLIEGMFNETGISMRTQFRACSFGKLDWSLAPAGVVDVRVEQPIREFSSASALVTAAQKRLRVLLNIAAVSSLGDRVIMCLPPGTGVWAASAGMGHWRAQFNHNWCLSLTALMHEIGHTIGLSHSNEDGIPYGDSTGYMAAGHEETDYPLKCFNGQKNHVLGWYSDRELRLNPIFDGAHLVPLATFIDYNVTSPNQPVLLNIVDQFFLQFNVARGMNRQTEEKRNRVTITEKVQGSSESRAGLDVGERYVISNFQGSGRNLIVEACYRRPSAYYNGASGGHISSPDMMVMSIAMDQSQCGAPTAPTTGAPPPTPIVTKRPLPRPQHRPQHRLPPSGPPTPGIPVVDDLRKTQGPTSSIGWARLDDDMYYKPRNLPLGGGRGNHVDKDIAEEEDEFGWMIEEGPEFVAARPTKIQRPKQPESRKDRLTHKENGQGIR